jgi:hypothetical protein
MRLVLSATTGRLEPMILGPRHVSFFSKVQQKRNLMMKYLFEQQSGELAARNV